MKRKRVKKYQQFHQEAYTETQTLLHDVRLILEARLFLGTSVTPEDINRVLPLNARAFEVNEWGVMTDAGMVPWEWLTEKDGMEKAVNYYWGRIKR